MNLRNLVDSVKNKLTQVTGTAKTNLSDWGKVVTNPVVRNNYVNTVVKPTVSKVVSVPIRTINTVKNIAQMTTNPFGRTQISDAIRSKITPNISFNKNEFYGVGKTTPRWEDLSNTEQQKINLMDQMDGLTHPQTKNSSAEVLPYFQPPTSDFKPNAIRDELVNKGGYTPQVKEYLKKIGIINQPEGSNIGVNWSAGVSYDGMGYGPKFIELSPNNGGYDPHTTGHELTHQIDSVAKSYKPDDFLTSVYESAKTNQELRPAIAFIDQYRENQPEYFRRDSNNGTLASEMFAEVGSRLGPAVLKDPQLAKYYKGIFQETPENYSGWVTPVPTPLNPNAPKPTVAPIQQTQKTQLSGYGTSVPSIKKSTKIILRKKKK